MEPESIPWRLSDNTNIPIWVWETDHFRAVIQTNSHRTTYTWDIKDYTSGRPQVLNDGFTGSFSDSEDFVRETIGKSYKKSLGYDKYAGYHATSFRIFSQDKIDFGPLISTKVTLTVRVAGEDGKVKDKRYIGRLSVENYNIKISPEHGNAVKIPPSRIVSIKREFGADIKPVEKKETLGKTLRTYDGEPKPGCTGKRGFMPNTVEHSFSAPKCPIHEL